MRILIVSPFPPPPEGIGRHSADLGAAWVRGGHEVRILAPGSAPADPTLGEQGLAVSRSLGLRHGPASREVVASFAPDLVLCQFSIAALTTSLFAALAACRQARTLGARVVVSFHEPTSELRLLGPVARLAYRRALGTADEVVAFSEEAAAALRRIGHEGSLLVLPLGIPRTAPPDPADVDRMRERYGLGGDTVLALGFVIAYKGTDVLLAAGQHLGGLRGVPTRILVAGEPRARRGPFRLFGLADQRHVRALHEAATTVGPLVEVAFSPFVPDEDLPALLAAVSVLAMPYRHIAQSGVATWALAAGLPVVASDLPGLREGLGAAGLYVPPDDPVALAQGLCAVLDDPGRRSEMAAAARALADAQSFDAVVAAISEVAGR